MVRLAFGINVLNHFVARKLSFSGRSETMDLNSHAPKEAFHLDQNNDGHCHPS
jgi:hypothetical protein